MTTTTFKAGNTYADALVYSDYLRDAGDDAAADRWQLLGHIQRQADVLWEKWGAFWSPTMLRTLPMMAREKGRHFAVNGRRYVLLIHFALRQVGVILYVESADGRTVFNDGRRYTVAADTTFNRTTLAKHGRDACLRAVASRLAK